ncbi:MAG: class I SAM-dependent methyltransferase [Ornithinibacter sp.]
MLLELLSVIGVGLVIVGGFVVLNRYVRPMNRLVRRTDKSLHQGDKLRAMQLATINKRTIVLADSLVAQQTELEVLRGQIVDVVRQEAGGIRVETRRQVRQAVNVLRSGAADESDHVAADPSIPLPPVELRMGGEHFKDDQAFHDLAARDVRQLEQYAGLDARSRLLDWGCGAGRLAVGVKQAFGHIADYHGVDVQAVLINWAKANLEDEHTHFTRVDLANRRYNPSGTREYTIPGDDASVDVFYAYSVFSHMQSDESAAYLKEIARLLAPGGRAVITGFVEEGVLDWAENPEGYGPLQWSGPLHCTRFDRAAFERLVFEAGLAVDRFVYGQETDGQSLYTLRHR